MNERFKNTIVKEIKYPTGLFAKYKIFLEALFNQGATRAGVRLQKLKRIMNFKEWGGFIFNLPVMMKYSYDLIGGIRQLKTPEVP